MSLVHADGIHKAAFRCRGKLRDGSECGHLLPSDAAGECEHPLDCPVCKSGLEWEHHRLAREIVQPGADVSAIAEKIKQTGPQHRTFQPANWEILADATPERLKELGLTSDDVCRHEPYQLTVTRSEPRQETYQHSDPKEDCVACRHGGRNHSAGAPETVTLTNPIHTKVKIGQARRLPPQVVTAVSVSARDVAVTSDGASKS